ncbi:zinc-ribbon domain-containing protein [Clostridium cibarium]|uniref:Metallophosphoesterase n=1 Tax=Clostridium cibarium TaxID=2762247 RepID=A0ABR8PV94_9CLOT|nr:zinc-ribbon domain-containing protein [Clostridium cibarium]MBD7912086.1 metallophosphoesterase [Clostridium cibarium]
MEIAAIDKDLKVFINQLKKKEIGFFDIPEEYRLHPEVVKVERKLGIRKIAVGEDITVNRGYDVIRNIFFVLEEVFKDIKDESSSRETETVFKEFDDYYNFLNGDIYDCACYYQYKFTQEEIMRYSIDLTKINYSALLDETIEDYSIEPNKNEIEAYKTGERRKSYIKQWVNKFKTCNSFKEFEKVREKCEISQYSSDLKTILLMYIYSDKYKVFHIIMKHVNSGYYPNIEHEVCFIYGSDKVLNEYNYSLGASSTIAKHKRKMKKFVEKLKSEELQTETHGFFNIGTYFYCVQTDYYVKEKNKVWLGDLKYYFETFEEFAEYLNNDLSNCDLSKAILPKIDFLQYITNKKTKLPIESVHNLIYIVDKYYDSESECFCVIQKWKDSNGNVLKEENHSFEYFFNYVYFLENDLSSADLLFCDGIENLNDLSELNLSNVKLISEIMDKLGLDYEKFELKDELIASFIPTLKFEEKTSLVLDTKREISLSYEEVIKNQKVFYISDLHLMHRIINAKCRSESDIQYVLQKIASNLVNDIDGFGSKVLLIGGDTSSVYEIFELFITLLRQYINNNYGSMKVIFLLGNHELWGFPDNNFEEIVDKYNDVITANGMYLLQNDLLYMDDNNSINRITTDELLTLSKEELRTKVRCARLIIFGGLAFSGYNKKFNADNGIYRETITREQEITESKKIESLYEIVQEALSDRNVIVFTHTPKVDWCINDDKQKGFIYVSGHTHRNYFYDDGDYKVYADNQVGYKNENPSIKYFYLENEYDLFSEYDDGIYQITGDEYVNFYRGKNVQMQFNRDGIVYMLKKKGYYCFIYETKAKKLSILNGGALKGLNIKDINYYYAHMEEEIANIKSPLYKYTEIQKKIAEDVKKIGGSGYIHGAIIDIDYYNHIYVNPNDLTIRGYYALDIFYKKIYPTIPKLLQQQCPELFYNYKKLIETKESTSLLVINEGKNEIMSTPQLYLETDIYKSSREIKKMQKLSSNILSVWYELKGYEKYLPVKETNDGSIVKNRTKFKHETISNHSIVKGKKESVPKQNPIEVKGSFSELYPDLLVDWDYEKNSIDPTQIIAGYSEKVFWKCNKCKNQWEARVDKRCSGRSICSNCHYRVIERDARMRKK